LEQRQKTAAPDIQPEETEEKPVVQSKFKRGISAAEQDEGAFRVNNLAKDETHNRISPQIKRLKAKSDKHHSKQSSKSCSVLSNQKKR
jgi:hypothetical protein